MFLTTEDMMPSLVDTACLCIQSGRSLWYYLIDDFLAASSMTLATFSGSCSIARWHVCNVTAVAPSFFDADSSMAGGSIRSSAEITTHDGFVFHAATVNFSPNIG